MISPRKRLISIVDNSVFIICVLVVSFLFIALTLAFFLVSKIFLAFIFLILTISVIAPLILLGKSYQKEKYSELGDIIFKHIVEKGIKHLNLDDFQTNYSVAEKHLTESAKIAYVKCVQLAMKDYVVTTKERKVLDAIAVKLEIEKSEANELEKDYAKVIYRNELDKSLGDGRLTASESVFLERIRSQLGLTMREAYEGSKKEVLDGYKKLFNRFSKDGILSADECEELLIYSKTTGLDAAHAAILAPRESENLYRRTVSMICQDGIIEKEEIKILNRIEELLKIPEAIIKQGRAEVRRTQELERIRKGQLPCVSNHDLRLNSTEICHWYSKCKFLYKTPTQQKEAHGVLAITDRRLIFLSDIKNFEVNIARIINFRQYTNGLDIEFTSNKGKGFYSLKDSEKLEAMLEYLTKKFNYIISENSDSVRSRHISDVVKVEVWQRDQGKCNKCGATDYLEFDHIIPFSRGGSNASNNIQLLCRRCNLAKGAELV